MRKIITARVLAVSTIAIVVLNAGMPQTFANGTENSFSSQTESQSQGHNEDQNQAQSQNGGGSNTKADPDQNGDLHSNCHNGHGEDNPQNNGNDQSTHDEDGGCTPAPSPLALHPSELPNGTVGASYSQTLNVTGGDAPFAWSLFSGTLPLGLSLGVGATAATTTIAGTPTATGTYSFVVRVANNTTSTQRSYTVTINQATSTCISNCGGGNAASSSLTVIVNVVNSGHAVHTASDFLVNVTGTNPSPASFNGSTSGTTLTLGNGTYAVTEATSSLVGYTAVYSGDCSGAMAGGESKTCTITDTNPAPPALDCSINGLYGTYYNLPSTLTGMEGPIMGLVTGTTPFQYPWYSNQYLSFERNDAMPVLNTTSNFFPVNDGITGDPFYFAVHWTGSLNVSSTGTYTVTYGSDDDMWVYVNHQLVIDNGGIHAFQSFTQPIALTAGTSSIDVYFAERHTVQSGIELAISGATFSPCPATSTPAGAPEADLAISKTVDNAAPSEGDTVNYTLTVSAEGPATSTGVAATDVLPHGLTFANATATKGTYSTSTGIWTIGDMSASSTASLTIAATVNAGTAGTTITNIGTVTESTTTVNITGTPTSSVPITVQTPGCTSNCGGGGGGATLGIVPSTLPDGTVGTSYSELLTAIGTAQGPFTWSVTSGSLPGGLTLNTSSTVGTSMISGTPIATGTYPFVITISNGTTAASQSYTVTVNAAACTSNCGGGNGNDADIEITKTVDNANPAGGDTVNYTLTVTALGPSTSSIVVANDILPNGLSLNSASTSVGTYNMSTGDWDIGTLSPSATATLTIAATVDPRVAGTTVTNTASVTELSSLVDPNPSNNSSSVSISVQPAGCTSNCGGGGGGCTLNCGGGGGGGGINVYPIVLNVPSYASTTVSHTLTVPVSVTDQNGYPVTITATSTGSATFSTSTMQISWTPSTVTTTRVTLTASDPVTHTSKTATLEAFASGEGGGGQVLGASTSTAGKVLGASTSCGMYMTHYIHLDRANDVTDTEKLQVFLNKWMNAGLPITGFYDTTTEQAVNKFQVKYGTQVLAPWVPYGLPNSSTPTGYVYKTTLRWINMLECPPLGLPVPPLP